MTALCKIFVSMTHKVNDTFGLQFLYNSWSIGVAPDDRLKSKYFDYYGEGDIPVLRALKGN